MRLVQARVKISLALCVAVSWLAAALVVYAATGQPAYPQAPKPVAAQAVVDPPIPTAPPELVSPAK
jgi:hypothetical protein